MWRPVNIWPLALQFYQLTTNYHGRGAYYKLVLPHNTISVLRREEGCMVKCCPLPEGTLKGKGLYLTVLHRCTVGQSIAFDIVSDTNPISKVKLASISLSKTSKSLAKTSKRPRGSPIAESPGTP